MSDIMERLRGLADLFEAGDAPRHVVLHMRAAADEIERLRFEISDKHNSVVFLRSEITKLTEAFGIQNAEVTRLRAGGCARDQGTTQYCAEAAKLAADNERLRAALREAYEVYAGSDGFIPETAGEGYQQQIIRQMVNCISAALGGVNGN